ncbi:MAG: hypothetical protein IMF01_06680 [Proteobacteria bacterium]|nr:hypothetical protein [Pseudomonadota bacterium]
MITENMIKAGKEAFYGHFKDKPWDHDCFGDQIVAIYTAMSDRKQEDAIRSIQDGVKRAL